MTVLDSNVDSNSATDDSNAAVVTSKIPLSHLAFINYDPPGSFCVPLTDMNVGSELAAMRSNCHLLEATKY